tara:strand:- start:709 stop:957 length:249 start_codon:yes stop_codon:yes gene_type:complete
MGFKKKVPNIEANIFALKRMLIKLPIQNESQKEEKKRQIHRMKDLMQFYVGYLVAFLFYGLNIQWLSANPLLEKIVTLDSLG